MKYWHNESSLKKKGTQLCRLACQCKYKVKCIEHLVISSINSLEYVIWKSVSVSIYLFIFCFVALPLNHVCH